MTDPNATLRAMLAATRTRLRAMIEKATPGPWEGDCNGEISQHWRVGTKNVVALAETSCFGGWETHYSLEISEADRDLIVAAINALPSLLDRIDELEAELGRTRA